MDKTDQKKQDGYRDMLIELYKENQSFLNKAIFTISSLAIPLLFAGAWEYEITAYAQWILIAALFGFITVIILQVCSLKYARDGCDLSLSKNDEQKQKDGIVLFDKAREFDIWRERIFMLSLIFIILSLSINILTKEKNMSDNPETPNQTQKMVEVPSGKEIQNSFTPPRAVVEEQKSFVPPQTVVSENAPQENESTKPSSSDGNENSK